MDISYKALVSYPGVELVGGDFITGIGKDRIVVAHYRSGSVNVTDAGREFLLPKKRKQKVPVPAPTLDNDDLGSLDDIVQEASGDE